MKTSTKIILTASLLGTGAVAMRYGVPWLFRSFTRARSGAERAAEFRRDAELYEFDEREELDGEEADVTVEASRRGPAERRIARRVKSVHVQGQGHVVNERYFGSVVADARCNYSAKGYSDYNAELARAYMVRIMRKHNVRPSDIDKRIDHMVNAVFAQSRTQQVARQERAAMLNPIVNWFVPYMLRANGK